MCILMKMAQTYCCAHDQPRKPTTETVTYYDNDIINLLGYEYLNINNFESQSLFQTTTGKNVLSFSFYNSKRETS